MKYNPETFDYKHGFYVAAFKEDIAKAHPTFKKWKGPDGLKYEELPDRVFACDFSIDYKGWTTKEIESEWHETFAKAEHSRKRFDFPIHIVERIKITIHHHPKTEKSS